MRQAFMDHVRRIQDKEKKKKREAGWRHCMKLASESWPKQKEKILRKRKREAKKQAKEVIKKAKTEESTEKE